MLLIVSKSLVPKGYSGMTVYPFIFLSAKKLKKDSTFINHEKIHLRQQAEMLVVFFFIWYVLEWLCRLMVYRNARKAYRNISFEREAYQNETDLVYLDTRPLYRFLKYL